MIIIRPEQVDVLEVVSKKQIETRKQVLRKDDDMEKFKICPVCGGDNKPNMI